MSHWQKEGKMPKLKNTPIHNKSQGCAPPLIFKDMIININRQKNLSLVWATEKMKFLFCATLWVKKNSRNAKLVAKSLRTPPPPICSVTTDLLSLCDNAVTKLWGAHDRRSLSSSSAPSLIVVIVVVVMVIIVVAIIFVSTIVIVIISIVIVIIATVIVVITSSSPSSSSSPSLSSSSLTLLSALSSSSSSSELLWRLAFFLHYKWRFSGFPPFCSQWRVNAFPSTSWCTLEELLSRGELISWCTTKEKWIKKNKKNTGFEIFQRRAQKKPETIKLLW